MSQNSETLRSVPSEFFPARSGMVEFIEIWFRIVVVVALYVVVVFSIVVLFPFSLSNSLLWSVPSCFLKSVLVLLLFCCFSKLVLLFFYLLFVVFSSFIIVSNLSDDL